MGKRVSITFIQRGKKGKPSKQGCRGLLTSTELSLVNPLLQSWQVRECDFLFESLGREMVARILGLSGSILPI